MKNQSKQCLCQSKGVTFISSYAYCEKCHTQLPPEKSSVLIERREQATAAATIREITETNSVYKKSRVGFGIY